MSNTDIPAAEVELDTKRQRLYHVTWLNRARLDKQLRPLLRDLEQSPGDTGRMGVLFKATFRGAVALVNHYLHFDIREHPSAIFLIMLKLIDDRSFNGIWEDYSPMIKWVNSDHNEFYKGGDEVVKEEPNSLGEVSPATEYERKLLVQYDTSPGLPAISSGDARVRKDNIQQDSSRKNNRKEADSDTGLET